MATAELFIQTYLDPKGSSATPQIIQITVTSSHQIQIYFGEIKGYCICMHKAATSKLHNSAWKPPSLASIKFSHTLLASAPPPKQAIRFQQPPSWFYDLRQKYVITNAIVIQGIGRRACNEKRENSKVFLALPRSCQIKCGIGTCCFFFFPKNQRIMNFLKATKI